MILIAVGHLGRKEHGNLEGHITSPFLLCCHFVLLGFIIIYFGLKNGQGVKVFCLTLSYLKV